MRPARCRLLLSAAALLGSCGSEPAEEPASTAPSRPAAEVRIADDPDGAGPEPSRTTTLRCPSPRRAEACALLLRLAPETFAPPPGDVVCTQEYGGPRTARVTGTVEGRRIDARFGRTDGCEINRFDAIAPLLDAALR